METELSVVIVNWNTCDMLRRCLASVYAQSINLSLEVIVVDNASHDESVQMVAAEFPETIVIANERNVGFATANNQGIRSSSGRYVVLLNPDTKIVDDALETMVEYMEQHPEVGVTGPRLILPNGAIQGGAAGYEPTPWTIFSYAFMLYRLLPVHMRSLWLAKKHYLQREVSVDWIAGACMMVRREAIEQVGLMDDGFFMYAEDMEWCHRIRTRGWRIVCLCQTRVIHYIGGSAHQKGSEFLGQNVRGLDRYYRQQYKPSTVTWMHLWGAAGFALRAVLYQVLHVFSGDDEYHAAFVRNWQCAKTSIVLLAT